MLLLIFQQNRASTPTPVVATVINGGDDELEPIRSTKRQREEMEVMAIIQCFVRTL